MKKVMSCIGISIRVSVLFFLMCSCSGGNNSNVGNYYNDYKEAITRTSEGLSELEKVQLEHKRVEEETRQQTIDFLNKAYGYDVSSYVD